MSRILQLLRPPAAAALGALLVLAVASPAPAEDIESAELRIALAAARGRIASLEAELASERQKNLNLGEALAASNAESIEFRDAYAKVREQMEGLGLTALDPSPQALQKRLLGALSDLRHAETQNRQLSDQILALHEAVLQFLDTAVSTSEDSRQRLDTSLREATASIGIGTRSPQQPAGDLHRARVISLKKELDLVVLNVGKKAGARIGMPFRIFRKDRPVGTALLVDVRDSISGAVLQTLVADREAVEVGDTAKIAPTNPL